MATKRVFAHVKPVVLRWARTSAGYSLGEAAIAVGIEQDDLEDWEAGIEHPTIPQLRLAAAAYKRPLSVFFLQDVPVDFQVLTDFRRPVSSGPRRYSPELTQEIRFAQQRRELAFELLEDLGDNYEPVVQRLSLADDVESAGEVIRASLGIEGGYQVRADAEGRASLNWWREKIEQSGILVFQTTRVSSEEASGFALSYPMLPVIVINRKDAPTRRLFSLLHEYAHLLLQQSGVSDLNIDFSLPLERPDIELFCNRVAAAALMPKNLILNEEIVRAHGDSAQWSDEEIVPLARRFGVSREALLLRLISLGRTNWQLFLSKRAQYSDEYERQRARDLKPGTAIKRNMPQETFSNFGRTFVGIVLGNYNQDRITLSEVSRYFGVRTRHIEPLQKLVAGG